MTECRNKGGEFKVEDDSSEAAQQRGQSSLHHKYKFTDGNEDSPDKTVEDNTVMDH